MITKNSIVLLAMKLEVADADLSYLDGFKDKDLIYEAYRPYVALAVEYGVFRKW